MINEILNAVFQVLVISLIPFLVYLVGARRARGFFDYVGLKRSTAKANGLAVLVALVFLIPPLALWFLSDQFRQIMTDPTTTTGKFRAMGLGVDAVLMLLVAAVFKTALSEELFFRGFVAKRLMALLGYSWGNITQAAIFGITHVLIFLMITTQLLFLTFMLVFVSLGAYLSAYLNEKHAAGSIVPSWISHGLANAISYGVIGFLL